MNLLFTSVGRRTYLVRYFREAMGGEGQIFVANSTARSPAFLEADHSVVTPLIYDDNYIPFLLNYCAENHIDALISLFDIDLPVLARNKDRFLEVGTRVLVSDPSVVDRCNDKWESCCFLQRSGIPCPRTFLTLESAEEACSSGELQFPVMVKPRWGMGSIGVYEAENREELRVFYQKARRCIARTYLKYESAMDLDRCILIQEKLEGQEYGLDVINDLEGRYCTTIPKKKCAMRSGETDCAVTVEDPELKALGRKLSGLMGHIGNLDVDVFRAGDRCCVLEMNARFGGGYPFSHLAGVDLPLAIVKWLRGQTVEPEILREKANVMGQKDITLVELPFDPDQL